MQRACHGSWWRWLLEPRCRDYKIATNNDPSQGAIIYSVHVIIRKSDGEMTRKLSVTESQNLFQFQGTFCRRKPSLASPSVSVLAPWRRAGTLLA